MALSNCLVLDESRSEHSPPKKISLSRTLLAHKDSYLQKTRWYKLYLDARISIPLPISLPPQNTIVATGKPPAAQSSSRRIGTDYDALIEDTVRQQVFSIFRSRRIMYKKSKGTATAKFKQSLSIVSYPQKVVSQCQEITEKKMLADGDKGKRSATWLASKLYAWKKRKNPFIIVLLVDEFMEFITAEEQNDAAGAAEKSITADVEEKVTGNEAEEHSGDDQPQEEEEADELLLQRKENLQDACHKATHGLSASINILVDLVFDGQFTATAQYFDYSSLDLHHRGIGADTHRMAVFGDIDQNALQLFDFHGLTVFSAQLLTVSYWFVCFHSISIRVFYVLSTHLQQDHRAPFICGSWIKSSWRQFFTNFSNIWSPASCAADLCVVIELLLRIHLCSQRFFNPKTYKKRASKDKDKLFWSLVKENRKEHVVIYFCERLFAFSSFPVTSDINAQIELPGSREASEVAVKKYQGDEMYESDDEFQIVESPDLPAKDIRALV
ncbi:hypothetical protein [Parasitella parasitica]|uniref:Uncharacterized protein n=1 Tax=Parasitella parasitica TaxID=35722 RepID=A0A0B7NIB6_9FUNG|nr:hypothetical protein [Parasitella parasitica]